MNKRKAGTTGRATLSLLHCCIAAALLPPQARAQESLPLQPAPPADAAAPVHQIEEVVVTATKRERALRDIPQSITAFNGGTLETQGKQNMIDFIQQSPGVVATQQSEGFVRVSMRGISTDTDAESINASPVGVFIGDTAFTDPYLNSIVPDMSAFDLASVQVLKGPQGTLFGGSALSGAIRYVMQEPVQGQWEVRPFTQYTHLYQGTSGWTHGVALNLPLLREDKLAFRFDYIKRNYPGAYTDERNNETGLGGGSGNQIRAQLLWEPGERWKIKLIHLSQDYNSPNAAQIADSPSGPRSTSKLFLANPSINSFHLDSFEVNYNFDSMRLVSLSSSIGKKAYVNSDVTAAVAGPVPPGYPPALGAFQAFNDNSNAWSQELRLQSTGNGPFQWLVGGYFYSYHLDFNIIDELVAQQDLGPTLDLLNVFDNLGTLLNQTSTLLYSASTAKSQEHALFLDLSYKPWDALELSAGARMYQTYVAGNAMGTGVVVLAENNGSPFSNSSRINERGINPKFSATYHFNRDIMLYALASKGFRFGGLQQVPSTSSNGVPATFKSDTLWNYETGLRTNWLHNTVHADITAFYDRYKNPILEQTTQGLPINYDVNASAAISRGFEASLLWHPPVRGLSLSVAGGLTDAHITKAFTAVGNVPVSPGQQMPGAARNQYSAAIDYHRTFWLLDGGGNLGYTYIGKGFNNITHDIAINDYGTLNAGVFLGSAIGQLTPRLSFNVSNVLNTTVPVAGSIGKSLTQTATNEIYTLNPPRTYTLRLSVDY